MCQRRGFNIESEYEADWIREAAGPTPSFEARPRLELSLALSSCPTPLLSCSQATLWLTLVQSCVIIFANAHGRKIQDPCFRCSLAKGPRLGSDLVGPTEGRLWLTIGRVTASQTLDTNLLPGGVHAGEQNHKQLNLSGKHVVNILSMLCF